METIKKNGASLLVAILFAILSFVPKDSKAQVGISVSFQQFYNQLSPYGDWIDDPNYGYIWVPRVENGFQPYATNGNWVMTEYGNTWVSNYDWGWAPFHYGRWHHSNRFGWAWVPGYEWAPAWVSWRTGGGYYGWAPLGPGMNIQVSVNLPMNYWTFVPQRYFLSNNIHRYYAPHRSVVNVYQRTTIINNTYVHNNRTYYSGPARRDIQHVTRKQVPVYRIADASRPGRGSVRNNTVSMYRPSIDRRDMATARPARVANRESASSQRSANTRIENRSNTNNRNSGNTALQRQHTRTAGQSGNSRNENRTQQRQSSTMVNRSTENNNRSTAGRSSNGDARNAAPVRSTVNSRLSSSTADNKKSERVQSSRPSAERRSSGTSNNSVRKDSGKKGQQQRVSTARSGNSRGGSSI